MYIYAKSLKIKTVNIPIIVPADILIALNESEAELKEHFQVGIAMMLYHQGKLTLGKAIQLSGLSRFEFEEALAKNKIPVSMLSAEQVFEDADKLKGL